jgi:uncharacterized protein
LLARSGIIALVAGGAFAFTVAPVLAHVTVHSTDAAQGSYAEMSFRVPTEKDNASTTKLVVHFPKNAPIPSVSVKPHPGWSFHADTTKLAKPISTHDGKVTQVASSITWTADSAKTAIKPGEFDEFSISAGPLPKVATMRFPAIQTYSDGDVVRWIETAAGGAAEPAHPAPTLHLATASSDGAAAANSSSGPSVSASGQDAPATAQSSQGDTTSLAVAIAALVVAVLIAVAGTLALRRKGAAR